MHRIDSALATDVCEFVSVDLLDTMVSHAKTDKPIDMPFWPAWSRVAQGTMYYTSAWLHPREEALYGTYLVMAGRYTQC